MKYILLVLVVVSVYSCKPCRECKYSTQKGTEMEKFCSSIRSDIDDFEIRMDSLAKKANSTLYCSDVDY